jgi:histidyl-tRNA synthetase
MAQVEARGLKGFRDYLPEVERLRRRMLETIAKSFESFGFGPLMTPALEYAEVLLGKYGAEGDKLLYRFTDNGQRDVAMRYDLTVPLARIVAQYGELLRPFKRYQIAPVWRAEKPGKGRFREFVQCDVDIVGEPSVRADAECMLAGLAALEALGVTGTVIRLNNRKVLDGILDAVGIADTEQRTDVLRVVDKLPKIGQAAVRDELTLATGIGTQVIDRLFDYLSQPIGGPADLEAVAARLPEGRGQEGVAELRELLGFLADAGLKARVEVDLRIARGLDYYTGSIYETFVTGRDDFGSVMSGGRYDRLLGTFLNEPVPAVGISIGIDRLLALLEDAGLVENQAAPADVYLPLLDGSLFGRLQALATGLRREGVAAEVALAPARLGKQLQRAEKAGYRWVVLVGADELAAGRAGVKDLGSGVQSTVAVEELATFLKARLSEAR